MPELPDVELYRERLATMLVGTPLDALEVVNPFVLRSVSPGPAELAGNALREVRRIGKRLALGFDGGSWAVIHLMVAGRLKWRPRGRKAPAGHALARFAFPSGTLHFTEAGTRRRASLHLVASESDLSAFERGGLEPLELDVEQFASRLASENHTLKRALTDPRLFSGIGNAYSDEILHRARLSPLQLTSKLDGTATRALHHAVQAVLREWLERLRRETADGFPEDVTAFRAEFAVHGRYRAPCPECGAPVQRIRYAENETNYCARCQTGGRLLADRALSRLLKADWPRSIDDVD
jgi:formamidopyrimidine-DNA glycosylase